MEQSCRRKFLHAAAVLICLAATGFPAHRVGAEETDILKRPEPWGQVMILGSYHMANPGLDAINLEADDVLAEKRQKEIKTLVGTLARFRPTRIAVEQRRQRADEVNAAYRAYVNGNAELTRNETQQIGFRLARRLGHEAVYPIDKRHTFMSEEHKAVNEARESSPRLQNLFNRLDAYGEAFLVVDKRKLATMAIGPYLRRMNSPEQVRANHDLYARFLMLAWHEDNQGGAYTVGNWYTRNILMFQNILRVMEGGKSERVLVIVGQGHVKILQDLVKDSPYTNLVDVSDYLPRQ